jgi:hypothetical protein
MLQDIAEQNAIESQILHPGSRKMFRHWEMTRAEAACPTREAFELAPIKDVMADMVIIDRDHLRSGFRYRLAGTRVCELYGRNITGQDVLIGWDNFEKDVIGRHLLTVVNQKQPAVIRMRLTTNRTQLIAAELLALPVAMPGSHRIQIIGGLFPFVDLRTLGHSTIIARELVSGRVIWTEHEEPAQDVAVDIPELRGLRQQQPFAVITGGKA